VEAPGGLWDWLGLGAGRGSLVGALCAQVDPEIFFPASGECSGPARRVCGACPVRVDCLAGALARREQYGVWGGLTASELRVARRRAAAAGAEVAA
jgi:WhiB family redox-sensing transcriptional regulator